MTKPKIEVLSESPTASAQILADDNHIEYETDNRGRRIGVKKLKFIDIHRLAKVVGGETAGNAVAFGHVLAAASVVEIDGDSVPKPGTNLQVDAIISRLDLDGLNVVAKALERLNPKEEDEASEESIKN